MNDYGYGLWPLVIFNSLLFIVLRPASSTPRRAVTGALLAASPPSSSPCSPRCTGTR